MATFMIGRRAAVQPCSCQPARTTTAADLHVPACPASSSSPAAPALAQWHQKHSVQLKRGCAASASASTASAVFQEVLAAQPQVHSSSSTGRDDDVAMAPDSLAQQTHSPHWMSRTALLVEDAGMAKLSNLRVLVVGLGGVGGYAAEALARAGVGHMTIVDGDSVDITNKNRQLLALDSTVGQPKAYVMAERLRAINPDLNLSVIQEFLAPEEVEALLYTYPADSQGSGDDAGKPPQQQQQHQQQQQPPQEQPQTPAFDYVVDAIDSVATKVWLLAAAHKAGIHVVSSMGAGGRMDTLAIKVVDISETQGDPLAANIRRTLRRDWGIRSGITCIFSPEPVRRASLGMTPLGIKFKRSYYGTISYIPALFGLTAAAYVINAAVDGPMLASVREARRAWRAHNKLLTPEEQSKKDRRQRSSRGGAAASAAASASAAAAAAAARVAAGSRGGNEQGRSGSSEQGNKPALTARQRRKAKAEREAAIASAAVGEASTSITDDTPTAAGAAEAATGTGAVAGITAAAGMSQHHSASSGVLTSLGSAVQASPAGIEYVGMGI